jgi:hypothetical protein
MFEKMFSIAVVVCAAEPVPVRAICASPPMVLTP